MATLSWGWWLSGVAYWGLAAAALVAAVLRMKKKGVSAAGVAVVVLVVGMVVAARGKVMEGMFRFAGGDIGTRKKARRSFQFSKR